MDAGIGSLRWALTRCDANGAGFTDTIKFNLNNPTNRIIILDSELPDISSKVIIDGTSQPGAALSAQTNAKILIKGAGYPQVRRGLTIVDASDVAIYGLAIVGFIPADPINDFLVYGDGIYMQNVSNIEIGAFQKGNIISGNYYGIRIDSIPAGRNPPPIFPSDNIRVYNNNIGPRAGISTGGNGFTQSGNLSCIYFNGAKNVVIGGSTLAEPPNSFEALVSGVQLIIKTTPTDNSSVTTISGNTLNPAGSFSSALAAITKTGINVALSVSDSYGYNPVLIRGNQVNLYNNGIAIANFKNIATVVQNELTCAAAPAAPLPHIGQGIATLNSDSAMIGGSVLLQNLVSKFPQGGVVNVAGKHVAISQNSIKCTGSSAINGITNTGWAGVPGIVIDSISATTILGRSCSTCKIEIFRNNECLPQRYNGKTYDTTVVCVGGLFRYDGPVDCAMTLTTTNGNPSTSKFYSPYNFIFDSTGLKITPSTCEKPGKISGIKFMKGVEWVWQNESGGVVARNDTNLLAFGGKYRLVATLTELGCILSSGLITIPQYNFGIDSTELLVMNPFQCKLNGGKVTGLKVTASRSFPTGPLKYEWKRNQSGTVVGTSLDLLNVGAGVYTLRITSLVDTSCYKEAGPYELILQPTPVMDATVVTLRQDTCGNSEGAINGISIINPGPAGGYLWVNESGAIVGSDSVLTGVPAGRYRLKYKDLSPCDTLYSAFYTITANGKVDINLSNTVIKPSGCGRNSGSITGAATTNATAWYWINVNTGDTVATTLNAGNIAAGIYRLIATNSSGCSRSSANVQVDSTTFIPLQITAVSHRPASCDSANAFIRITQFNADPSFYQFKWLSTTGTVVGTTSSLSNIDEGIYRLLATDSNGCSKIIFTDTIVQKHKVTINVSELYREADTCSLFTGRFSNIQIRGGQFPYTYRIADSSGRLISTNAGATGLAGGLYNLQATDFWGCVSPVYAVIVPRADAKLPTPFYPSFYVLRGSDTAISLASPYTNGGKYQLLDAGRNLISENTIGRFEFRNLQNDFSGFVRLTRGSCTAPDAVVKIIIADTLQLKIPNAFSPNGDGINDVFTIRYRGVPLQMQVDIFDRYGKLVYASKDFDKPWNGNSTNGNKPMPVGTYYWIIKGKDILGVTVLQQGSVTLLK